MTQESDTTDTPRPVVLVVDDVPANLLAFESLLRCDDFEIATAASGKEALEILLERDVALAVVDVQMPEMDGFELATLMRGVERTRYVPIIFLTASSRDEGLVFTGYEVGAVDYLFKPVDPQVLRGKVEVFVSLAKQRMELREAKQMRETFMAVLGHDLRHPLGGILMTAQLLARQTDCSDEELMSSLARIVRSGRRMKRMIDDLLDATRFRNDGFIALTTEKVSLDELVDQVLEEVEAADERVRVEVLGDATGTWDLDRLLQVLSNLVGNAARYSPPGSCVTITLDGRAPRTVGIHVHNAGPPIPNAQRPLLFEPFRASTSRRGQHRGLGLGLYITKRLVEAHGGNVTFESSEEEGTTFSVTLPRGVRSSSETNSPPPSAEEAATPPRRGEAAPPMLCKRGVRSCRPSRMPAARDGTVRATSDG